MNPPGPPDPEETIDCIDCGGRCHRLGVWDPAEPPRPGDLVVYRCADCLDAWYLEVPEAVGDDDPERPGRTAPPPARS